MPKHDNARVKYASELTCFHICHLTLYKNDAALYFCYPHGSLTGKDAKFLLLEVKLVLTTLWLKILSPPHGANVCSAS